jgi:hypothetical protein
MSPRVPPATRVPRAGIDPITDEATALALLRLVACPTRHETILVLLDDDRRGMGLVVVSDTAEPDAVVEVADRVLDPAVHDGRVAAVVVATLRPGGGDSVTLGDADRWLELDDVADRCCVELVEWFVLAGGVSRPRELVNAPPRW